MDTITDYVPPATGAKFMQSDALVRLIKGPVGCIHGSTPVVTEFGLIPIDQITRPMRVLSWNEKTCQFQLSWCGGSFPKGKDYLYRVSTPQGEFDAAGAHLLLCADGEYRRVSELQVGDVLDSGSPDPLATSSALARQVSHEDARRSIRTAVDYLGDCARSARRYGQQLLQDVSTAPVFVPSPDGAQVFSECSSLAADDRMGGSLVLTRKHTRTGLSDALQQTKRSAHPSVSDSAASEDRGAAGFFERVVGLGRSLRQFLLSWCCNWQELQQRLRTRRSLRFATFKSPESRLNTTNRPIISLTRKQVEDVYWDLQVADTHNYVTVDGAVHHNSGKSTVSLVEIFRRCAEIPKCKDGFRRSRWVLVRNTNQQLKTTTLKSWVQWFPPGVAGTWKESEKTFLLTVGDIRAELLFLPLDSPDDTARLLSLELTGAFINEAREVAPEIIQAVISRLGRYPSRAMLPKGTDYWYGLIMDTNPPSRDSWLYEKFEEEKPNGWEIFHQPGGLDPEAENRENLPASYYEEMMNGASEDWIDVHVHGKYGRSLTGRPVYEKSFSRGFHVAASPLRAINSENHTVIIGMDFGRTPAAVIGQRDAMGRMNVLDSIYVENIGLKNFLEVHLTPLLREKFPYNKYLVVGDPAGWAKSQLSEESAFDVLRKCGYEAVRAPTNDIDKRIAAVEGLLLQQTEGKPMMRYSPPETSAGMKHLITGLDGSYKYKRKTDGSYDLSPAKDQWSHDNDALQYLALGSSLSGGSMRSQAVPIKPSPRRII